MIRRGGEGEEEREGREGEEERERRRGRGGRERRRGRRGEGGEGGRGGEGEDIPIDGPCLLTNPAPVDKIMVSDIQLFPTNYLSLSV